MDYETTSAVAVDPATNDVYVDNLETIAVFGTDPSCTLQTRCDESPPGSLINVSAPGI